jgi:large subunit ribosomal protein L18
VIVVKKIKPTYKMPFRRRREGKTDYSKRLALLKSEMPRIVVRKSLKYITAQIVEYDAIGDNTIASATSKQLKALGWKFSCDNIPAAYLTGLLIAKEAEKKKVKKAVLDIGIYESTKGSRIYAVVKGAKDGGLDIAANEEMFPSEDRISGKHIAEQGKFKDMPIQFEKAKEAILGKVVKGKKKEE